MHWKAIYNDGTDLPQYNEDGSVNKYPDIDRKKLSFFEIYKGDKLIFRLHLCKGRRLIYRKRVTVKMMSGERTNVYLVGWQETVNGKNVQDIAYIFEDSHIELAGRWSKENILFCAPNLIECEKEG